MTNAFLIFPEEVWEMILEQVEDSLDYWNLLKAFPQLDVNSVIQKKKHLGLFGLIVPHLMPWKLERWIKEKYLLNCRLVCRRWSAGVDTYLQNHPQLCAYRPETQSSQSSKLYWNVKSYRSKNDYDYSELVQKPGHLGGVKLNLGAYEPDHTRFLHDMVNCPTERNPFLSRSLNLQLLLSKEEGAEGEEKYRKSLEDIVTLHKNFGKHVWFYKLHFYLGNTDPALVTECFTHLSNLRSLDASTYAKGELNSFLIGKLEELSENSFPPMPYLESLRINNTLKQFGHFLIHRFSTQIRRLEVELRVWKPEYNKMFPNLTELEVIVRDEEDIQWQLRMFLNKLETPQLAKLRINLTNLFGGEMQYKERESAFYIEHDVFGWLKKFPNLKYLDFGEECRIVETRELGHIPNITQPIFPSLQFLAIRTSIHMHYNFFKNIPSLKHLQLYVHPEPDVIYRCTSPLTPVRVKTAIQTATIYDSNIWNLLPKLRTVTLLVEDTYEGKIWMKYVFDRKNYEYKLKNGLPLHDHLRSRRPDINRFMNGLRDLCCEDETSSSSEEDYSEEEPEDVGGEVGENAR